MSYPLRAWNLILVTNVKLITAFILKDGQYGRPNLYSDEEEIKPSIFADLNIILAEVFVNIELEEDELTE